MRVLLNSLPKSGTHLLEKALLLMGLQSCEQSRATVRRVTDRIGLTSPPIIQRLTAERWGMLRRYGNRDKPTPEADLPIGVFSPYHVSRKTFRAWVAGRPDGTFIKAHIPHHPDTADILRSEGYCVITIIRDPRAVLTSMIPYIHGTKLWTHFLQPYFTTLSAPEQVEFVIHGGYAEPPGIPVLPLREAFVTVNTWSAEDNALVVRFEDLIGAAGGGTQESQKQVVGSICDHLSIPFDQNLSLQLDKIFDKTSPTFRCGRVDSWTDELNRDQIEKIEKALGEQVLIAAGYRLHAPPV